ncbi:MAG: 50S ribosomal protein L11 methyltransferase [Gammaproteobacteria bacterium]
MALPQLVVLTLHPEFAEEILLAHGAQSVTQVDAADDPVLEPAPGATPLWPRTRTIGLFPQECDFAPVIAALRDTLPDGAAAIITTAELAEQDWVRIWLRDWQPLRFGRQLWVSPRAKVGDVRDPGAVIVALDPGLAFGTGTHPSTALCLEWLAATPPAGRSVLDFGCGSGLLAIAALKLGAARATGVDIDPQALLATRENALANGVAGRLRVTAGAEFDGAVHEVVLANILARPLVELAPRLCAALAPGGDIVLAGILDHQAAEVADAFAPWCEWRAPARHEGWTRLHGRKRG